MRPINFKHDKLRIIIDEKDDTFHVDNVDNAENVDHIHEFAKTMVDTIQFVKNIFKGNYDGLMKKALLQKKNKEIKMLKQEEKRIEKERIRIERERKKKRRIS